MKRSRLLRMVLVASALFFPTTPAFSQHMDGGHGPDQHQQMQDHMQRMGDMMAQMQEMMSRIQDMDRHMSEMMQGQSGMMEGPDPVHSQPVGEGTTSGEHSMGMMNGNAITHVQEMIRMMEQTGHGMQQVLEHIDAMMKDAAIHQNERMEEQMDAMGKRLHGMMEEMDGAVEAMEEMTGHQTPAPEKE